MFSGESKVMWKHIICAVRYISINIIANHASKMSHINQNEATSVICRNIKPGYEKDYDNWLKRYLALQKGAPGYQSITIIIPGEGKSSYRYIIRKFSNKTDMEKWDNSSECLNLIDEANKYSTRHYETSTGLETWFTLPGLKTLSQSPPPKWKMAIVIFFAAYVISIASRYLLSPFIGEWPPFVNLAIFSATLVILLTYFALPILSRIFRRWLYPGNV